MPRKSSVKRLPPDIRDAVHRLLDSGRTLDEIRAHLEGLGADVSRSALGRYAQKYEEVAAKLRESREVSAAFARELGDIPDSDMGRTLVELLHGLVFRVLMQRTEEKDEKPLKPMDLMLLAKAIKESVGSTKISAELEIKIRDRAKHEAEEEIRRKLGDAVGERRLDPAVAEEALRVLGFA